MWMDFVSGMGCPCTKVGSAGRVNGHSGPERLGHLGKVVQHVGAAVSSRGTGRRESIDRLVEGLGKVSWRR